MIALGSNIGYRALNGMPPPIFAELSEEERENDPMTDAMHETQALAHIHERVEGPLHVFEPETFSPYDRVVLELVDGTPTLRKPRDDEEAMACLPPGGDYTISQDAIAVPDYWFRALVARYNAVKG